MSDNSKIEWTDATWNPITGCTVHSAGCTNCYAMQLAGTRLKDHPSRKGLTREVNGNHVWTGEVRFNEQWLLQPLQWKRPRDIFVCAHADLFHKDVPDEWIDKIFAVMALAPHHRFQVLTKRSDRMLAYLTARWPHMGCDMNVSNRIAGVASEIDIALWNRIGRILPGWPLPNVWLGVSVEDQRAADERIPDLLATPAAIRWLSCEPLLGPVDLTNITGAEKSRDYGSPVHGWSAIWKNNGIGRASLDWIVCGGESGRKARPMHPDWARSLRDQCAAAGVPFHFKQWGEWAPLESEADWERFGPATFPRCQHFTHLDANFARVGKKAAGRLLDGVQHDGTP